MNYQGTVPRNFYSPPISTDAATTTYAGPFSGVSSYDFYVPSLPPHLTGTLTFDLLAIGNWSADTVVERVNLALNGTATWSQDFPAGTGTGTPPTPKSSGTLAGGTPYAVYGFTVPFTSSVSQLSALITSTGVDGAAGEGFGIDNVTLAVSVVPPQTFPVTLTSTVSIANGSPAAGAGNLESVAARDQYTFAVAAGKSVYIHPMSCPGVVNLDWALVNDATGVPVASATGCTSKQVDNLPAATYRLVVSPGGTQTGPYTLEIVLVPAAQVFPVTLTSTVSISNGVPAAGAGNLETVASQDQYKFTVAAGASIYVNPTSCPGVINLNWAVVVDGTGAAVASGNGCAKRQIDGLATGTYRLVVTPQSQRSGTYALDLILVPAPQVFDVSLASTISVSNGVPGAGAGNLETVASQDQYRFTLATAKSVFVDVKSCPGVINLEWSLVSDSTGSTVASASGCADKQVDGLPAGTYRLIVIPQSQRSGTYTLDLFTVDPPQVFNVNLASPLAISNGVPAAGAGNLETVASQDQYRFTLTSTQAIYVNAKSCPGVINLNWALVADSTGAPVDSADSCDDKQINTVPAGTYRLVVTPQSSRAGTYTMDLLVVPAPQAFNVNLSSPLAISDGVPAAGAGNLETIASQDQYKFTLASTQAIYVNSKSCPGVINLNWALVVDSTGVVVDSATSCADKQINAVPAGTYRLVVSPQGQPGTYTMDLLVVPAPQTFTVSLASPLAISNGVPAAGAGNLETVASVDQYKFTVTAGQSVYVDAKSCPGVINLAWKLVVDSTSAVVDSATSCRDKQINNLAAGTYRLVVTPEGLTGTYTMGLLIVPAAQTFNVSLAAPVAISNGVPAAGAGNLETVASVDQYRFTVTAGTAVTVEPSACPGVINLAWKLVVDSTGVEVDSRTSCSSKQVAALAAGTYRVVVTPEGQTGTYSMRIYNPALPH